MSVKSDSRKCGRMIRRLTKMPLPIAMRLGRMVVKRVPSYEFRDKFSEHVKIDCRMGSYDCEDYVRDFKITFIGETEVTFLDYVSLDKIRETYEEMKAVLSKSSRVA
jgi:hypothetical protein